MTHLNGGEKSVVTKFCENMVYFLKIQNFFLVKFRVTNKRNGPEDYCFNRFLFSKFRTFTQLMCFITVYKNFAIKLIQMDLGMSHNIPSKFIVI